MDVDMRCFQDNNRFSKLDKYSFPEMIRSIFNPLEESFIIRKLRALLSENKLTIVTHCINE